MTPSHDPRYSAVNSKLIQATVGPGHEVFGRRGSMLAYTGAVSFAPTATAGAGIGGAVGRALAGEHTPMMRVSGRGTVLFGRDGLHVEPVELRGETLCAESDRLLVHDASLRVGTLFLGEQGGLSGVIRGQMTGQGLFTTTLTGHGWCALLSHGGVVRLPVAQGRQVQVDPQAYVAHQGTIRTRLHTALGLRELLGRGSGEGFQLELTGDGVVYVQASERRI